MNDENYFGNENRCESDELEHYGTPRHSGRYPWGSGDNPYQRDAGFLSRVHTMREQGLTDTDIYKSMGMNSSQFRKALSLAKTQQRSADAAEAWRLHEKGYSTMAIGRRMGKNESTIRLYLDERLKERANKTRINADILKEEVDRKDYLDVSSGNEIYMGITKTRLGNALEMLKQEGYVVLNRVPFKQLGTGHNTYIRVLAKPGTTWKDVITNRDKIKFMDNVYSEDGGKTMRKIDPPVSIDSNRILVKFKEDGGADRDGLIQLRRGVDDISLGNAKYAQVRIAVDGTHYLKGMAVYSDDIPKGYDIVFNSNKSQSKGKLGAMKEMDLDNPENPFGASIKAFDDQLVRAQRHYIDKNGNEQQSALNIVNEEGDWLKWSKSLASQMLSKQYPALAKQQLDISYGNAKSEYDEISKLTNPTVKADLLNKFASQCDSDATDLQAAALPRQATKVILPFPDMKDTEIYAPHLRDGERVALIRYPHGGIFEIPELTVNNKYPEAQKVLGGNAIDAVGISPKTAVQLSGADFDGDNVIVIPIDKVKIKSSPYLEGLKDFDPKEAYPEYPGMHIMTDREKGLEMGNVSNLITDMTIKGADPKEICRAVKHSMVVIDAKKHRLNYKQSAIDNGIAELKEKYQGGANRGAATLISRSTSMDKIPEVKQKAFSKMTPEEREQYKAGKLILEPTGAMTTVRSTHKKLVRDMTPEEKERYKNGETIYSDPVWEKKLRLMDVSRMSETDDAYSLVSGTPASTTRIERIYADYANRMKALANSARAEARATENIKYDPEAKKIYSKEVESLNAKLQIAKKNDPLERKAQLMANAQCAIIFKANKDIDKEHAKRIRGVELDKARRYTGASKKRIGSPSNPITDKEWEAINKGAISPSMLRDILNNADSTRIRQLATPRSYSGLSSSRIARAKSLLNKGYSQSDVADMLDISVSTLVKSIGVENI